MLRRVNPECIRAQTTKAVGSSGLTGRYPAPTTKAVGSSGLTGRYPAPTTKAVGSKYFTKLASMDLLGAIHYEPTDLPVGLK